jgi:hypothetical protein
MAKPSSIDEALAKLSGVDLTTDAGRNELRQVLLQSKSNLVVAKAARLIAKSKVTALAPDLESAFPRFMANPKSTDKGCAAKLAIAQALYEMGHRCEAVFLSGIHHIQKEPAFGGPVDTAAELRGTCALGLVRMGYSDILTELADLLVDSELTARMMAARAIAYTGQDAGVPLLRMRILAGDADSQVLNECFTAILRLQPRKSLALVARFLDSSDHDLAQASALAIASTHLPEAFTILRTQWDRNPTATAREPLLLPLATLRLPEAIDMLLGVIREAHPTIAAAAIEAMAIYRHDDSIRAKVTAAAESRRDPAIHQALAKAFGE